MILVFGKNGQVATALADVLPQAVYLGASQASLLEPQRLAGHLEKHQPSIVINCSGYTAIDKSEEERKESEAINAKAPAELARWCAMNDALLVHFSSAYVYQGDGSEEQSESAVLEPQNWYGHTKLAGEEAIRASACRSVVLRTSWVYSHRGHNFVRNMLRQAEKKKQLSIVSDQFGSPTYAPDLAQTVLQIIEKLKAQPELMKPYQVFNVANTGFTSWHGFAEEIFRQAGELKYSLQIEKVNEISSEDYPTVARRPKNSRLDQTKISQHFGIQLPKWQDSLNLCLRRLKG